MNESFPEDTNLRNNQHRSTFDVRSINSPDVKWLAMENFLLRDIPTKFVMADFQRNDFKTILPHFEILLDKTTDQKLRVDDEIIFFNGIDDYAHETFCLERIDSEFKNRLNKDESAKCHGVKIHTL